LGAVATVVIVGSGPQVVAGIALAGGGGLLLAATMDMDRQQPQNTASLKRKASAMDADSVNASPSRPSLTGITVRFGLSDTTICLADNNKEQTSLQVPDRQPDGRLSITFPEFVTGEMSQRLYCIIRQIPNLVELRLACSSAQSYSTLCLTEIARVLLAANPTQLQRVLVKGVGRGGTMGTPTETKLGSALAGLSRCTELSIEKLEGAFSVNACLDMQMLLTDQHENSHGTLTYMTKQDNHWKSMHQKRFDNESQDQLVAVLQALKSDPSLIELRLDLVDTLDANSLAEPLAELLIENTWLTVFHLANVRTTKEILDKLIEALCRSKVTSFETQVQERNLDVIAKYSPAMTTMLKRNTCLKRFVVQCTGFAIDFDWKVETSMYLKLNCLGRQQLVEGEDSGIEVLLAVLEKANDDLTSLFYFLSHRPSLWS
jgi:hypothetical protein